MKIQIWSDVVCPFCALGKKNLETALAQFPDRHAVTVEWRSFELDPEAPRVSTEAIADVLARKYGRTREWALKMNAELAAKAAQQGVTFHFERVVPTNSFDAHRLIQFAARTGKQDAVLNALFTAYFADGKNIADASILVTLARGVGLDGEAVAEMLAGDSFSDAVRADEAQAHALGINGVPFFLINDEIGISGAHPPEAFLDALQQIAAGNTD